jgi:hypothetical protein
MLVERGFEQTAEEREVPKWSLTLFTGRGRWHQKSGRWAVPHWPKRESIEIAFKEPFQVLGKGEDFFFLTDAGRLFVAKKVAKGKERKMALVWSDPARPVRALITDADADRTFLFVGPARPGGRPAFFELSDRPRLEEYGPTLEPALRGDELQRVLAYARVLVAAKKVRER